MSKHTPEPWKKWVYKDGVCFVMAGGYARGTAPASPVTPCIACLDGAVLGFGYEQNEANGDRIVACVNALAGIPDPAAYIKAMREVCEAQIAADDAIDAYEKNDDLDPEILGAALKRRRQAIDAYRTLSTPESEVKRG